MLTRRSRVVARGDFRFERDWAILKALPDFDSHRAGRHGDREVAGGVEEVAEVADRRLGRAVAGQRLGPGAGQAERRQRVLVRLIVVAVGADHVHAAERPFAGRRVDNLDLQLSRVGPIGYGRVARFVESGRREDQRFVHRIKRDGVEPHVLGRGGRD